MHTRIKQNLTRQDKAFMLLKVMLDEEFLLLRNRDPQAVTRVEFSIHELLRQIAEERESLKAMLSGRRVLEYAASLPPELDDPEAESREMQGLLKAIDAREQDCARQAERNAELVLGLMDQGKSLLDFLHEQVAPKKKETYSAKGRYTERAQSGNLIRGAL